MDKWTSPSIVVAVLALILGVMNAYYARSRSRQAEWKKDVEEVEKKADAAADRVAEIEGDLKVLKKQMDVFWGTVEKQMARKFRDEE